MTSPKKLPIVKNENALERSLDGIQLLKSVYIAGDITYDEKLTIVS